MVGKSSGDSLAVYSFKGTIPKGSKFSNPFKVYIQSNLHGNEGLTRTVTQFMMNRLLTNTGPLFGLSQQGVSFDFLPVANPTGARLVTRHNSANFDLNRNFSQFWMPTSIAPGPAPFSERETQLIRTLFQENNYNVAIDIENFY
jgi:murein tripeptide amidase MpaA